MISNIEEYDIRAWVEKAPTGENREFREAVHTILSAIASDQHLKASMILKGGILLAIRYHSHRYTTDIDFSTDKKVGGVMTAEGIRESLNNSLAQMVEVLEYDLDCRVQSSKLQPKNPNSTHPSIKMKVGYAYKGTPKHKRLEVLQSTDTISIDFSLNEIIPNIETVKLDIEEDILAYSFTDVIAEKYRSLLQQIPRNRYRMQDIYDLNLLIDKLEQINNSEKSTILECLINKSKARNIEPTINSFDDPELKFRAEKLYKDLEIAEEEKLPDFDTSFKKVSDFYKALPWK